MIILLLRKRRATLDKTVVGTDKSKKGALPDSQILQIYGPKCADSAAQGSSSLAHKRYLSALDYKISFHFLKKSKASAHGTLLFARIRRTR